MEATLSGMDTEVNPVQWENAPAPMVVMPSGKVTLFNPVQSLNAPVPMRVTLRGMDTLVRSAQPLNTCPVMDDTLSVASSAILSERVSDSLVAHDFSRDEANHAALFVEEIGLTILEKNKKAKKPVLIEFSLFYEGDSVLIVERDSGDLFDLTDSYSQVKGLSSFILTGLMKAHDEKKYLVTTGYNRNMIRFARGSAGGEEPVDPGIII